MTIQECKNIIKDFEKLKLRLVVFKEQPDETSLDFDLVIEGQRILSICIFKEKDVPNTKWKYYFNNSLPLIRDEKWLDIVNKEEEMETLLKNVIILRNWTKTIKKEAQSLFKKYKMEML